MPVPWRSALVGTGAVAHVHAAAVRAAGGTISVVLGRSPTATGRAVTALGAGRGAADLDDLLGSGDVDVVHVCTPNDSHVALAEAALSAGRHVVCEKPLATSVSQARHLVDLAEAGDRVACVPFVYRFYGAVREARRLLAAEPAPLWLLHGTYLQDWLAPAGRADWRVDPSVGGPSRAFADIGVHWCDLMEFVTGHRVVRLAAQTGRAHRERAAVDGPVTTEDGAVVLFETDLGAVGSLVVSQATPGRKNRLWFSFDGPDHSYSFDQESPEALWVGGLQDTRLVMRGSGDPPAGGAWSRLPPGHPQGFQDAFTGFVADVYAAVGGAAPDGLPTFADGLRAAVLTDAVLRAAATSAWVPVPSSAGVPVGAR